jgi:hypothetical protein
MWKAISFLGWLVVTGCSSKQPGNAVPKATASAYKKSVKGEGYRLIAEAFPQGHSTAGEWTFKAGLLVDKDEMAKHKALPLKLQYGVDSLFFLVHARDTLWPSYVLPVANGQPLYPQFIVGFEPVAPGKDSLLLQLRLAELTATEEARLLFSQQLLQRLYQ